MTTMDYRHRCTTAECPYLGQLTDNLSCGCHRKEADTMREELARLTTPQPIAEYHEDMGPVLWWKFPIVEEPYVGSPLDCGFTVQVETKVLTQVNQTMPTSIRNFDVGGWPGYHTHFTPIPKVKAP